MSSLVYLKTVFVKQYKLIVFCVLIQDEYKIPPLPGVVLLRPLRLRRRLSTSYPVDPAFSS